MVWDLLKVAARTPRLIHQSLISQPSRSIKDNLSLRTKMKMKTKIAMVMTKEPKRKVLQLNQKAKVAKSQVKEKLNQQVMVQALVVLVALMVLVMLVLVMQALVAQVVLVVQVAQVAQVVQVAQEVEVMHQKENQNMITVQAVTHTLK